MKNEARASADAAGSEGQPHRGLDVVLWYAAACRFYVARQDTYLLWRRRGGGHGTRGHAQASSRQAYPIRFRNPPGLYRYLTRP